MSWHVSHLSENLTPRPLFLSKERQRRWSPHYEIYSNRIKKKIFDHRQSSKQRPIKDDKKCKVFSLCTNASYWFERNGMMETKIAIGSDHLPVRWHLHFVTLLCRSYRFSQGYIGEYKCIVIGLCLLVHLQFLSRLHRRIQVYCYWSLFTSSSTVSLQAT